MQGRRIVFALSLCVCTLPVHAQNGAVHSPAVEPDTSGWAFTFDNDALVPGDKDIDYTGGFAYTRSGADTTRSWLSLHALVDAGIERLSKYSHRPSLHSLRGGMLSFTPDDLKTSEVITDDRPYSSLVFISSFTLQESDDGNTAVHGGITLGLLGLELAALLQKEMHRALGANIPRGWAHQISAGGEPTINLLFGAQRHRGEFFAPWRTRLDLKSGWDVAVGFESAAAYGWSLRWGRYNTPWWSYSPAEIGYISPAAPAIRNGNGPRRELYLTLGGRVKLRAYNAFLQGQFRETDHRLSREQLQPVIAEGWMGVNWQFLPTYRAGWLLRAQTTEIRRGVGDRGIIYGGLFLTRDL